MEEKSFFFKDKGLPCFLNVIFGMADAAHMTIETGDRIIFEHIQIKRPITGVFGKFFDKPASQTAALAIGQNI